MSGAVDPHRALARILTATLGSAPVESRSTPWCSASFSGERHRFRFAGVNGKVATLPGHEFDIRGHIIADVAVIGHDGDQTVVEILSVAES